MKCPSDSVSSFTFLFVFFHEWNVVESGFNVCVSGFAMFFELIELYEINGRFFIRRNSIQIDRKMEIFDLFLNFDQFN